MLALVRTANQLDNADEEKLMSLADSCIVNLKKKTLGFKKEAIGPLAVVGITAALLGALYVQQHMPMANSGFVENHKKLIAEINDLLEDEANFAGVGTDYAPKFKLMLIQLKEKLEMFYSAFNKNFEIITEISKPRTAEELENLQATPIAQKSVEAYNLLYKILKSNMPFILAIESNFKSETYKALQIKQKGIINRFVDWFQVFRGGKGLIADDFDDVRRAIPNYIKSCGEILEILEKGKNFEKKSAEQLSKAQAATAEAIQNASSSGEGAPTGAATPSTTPGATGSAPPKSALERLQNEVAQSDNILSSTLPHL
jgi:predicted DNA-binding protein YlxM (UPF0122 family)